jgi:hypothetical protein
MLENLEWEFDLIIPSYHYSIYYHKIF